MRIKTVYIVCLLVSSVYLNAQTRLRDSLRARWSVTSLHDTDRLWSLDKLISKYYMNTFPDSAFYFARIQYDYSRKHNQPFFMTSALNNLGLITEQKGNYSKALDFHKRSLKIADSLDMKKPLAHSLNNIGICYSELGDYATAVEYFYKSLKVKEQIGDIKGTASAFGNIASMYITQGNYSEALPYMNKSLAIYRKLKEPLGEARLLGNIASLHQAMGDIDAAIKKNREALAVYKTADNQRGIANILFGLGECYEETQWLNTGDSCYNAALKIRIPLKDSSRIAYTYYGLGKIALLKKDRAKAIRYGEEAMKIALALKSTALRQIAGNFLHKLYAETGDYKKAYEILEIVRVINDTLAKQELGKRLTLEQVKYSYDKKELEKELETKLDQQRKQAAFRAAFAAEKNRTNIILISSILLLVLILAGIFVYMRVARQKRIIADQRNKLLKQKLLITQINPHFIFNSLNAIQQYIFSQDSLKAGNYLAQFADLMRMILDFSREDYITIKSECDFLTQYLELQQLRFREKLTFHIEIDPDIDTDHTLIPPMLAQPFVENSVEHGILKKETGGHILIQLFMQDGQLWYRIDDNGIGMKASEEIRLRSGKKHKSLATVITGERLSLLEKKQTPLPVQITDKPKDETGTGGVTVCFAVPFKER